MLVAIAIFAILLIAYLWYSSSQGESVSEMNETIEQDLHYENNSKKDESDAAELPNIQVKNSADVSGQTDDTIIDNKGLKPSIDSKHVIIPKDPDDELADANLTNAEDNGGSLVSDSDEDKDNENKGIWDTVTSWFSSSNTEKNNTGSKGVDSKVAKKITYPFTRNVKVVSGQLLNQILATQGYTNKEAYYIIQELDRQGYSPVSIHPGDQFTFIYNKPKPKDRVIPAVVKVRINYKKDVVLNYTQPADIEHISAEELKKLFVSKVVNYKKHTRVVKVEGIIKTSLDSEAIENGMSHGILYKFKNLYGWSIDFRRNIHPGDKFQVMYKQDVYRNDTTTRNSKILYANLNISHHDHPLYFFTYSRGMSDYFNSLGMSARHTLLRRPVLHAYISSKFSPRRYHPILHKWVHHTGIDYAVAKNTPIFAGGKGVIQFRGWIRGYGNVIIIRHNSVYTTYYAHMDHFQGGLRVGSHVRKGQVIGFVGMTGYATGYHVHYEIRKYGHPIDPLGPLSPAGENLRNRSLRKFKQDVVKIKALYQKAIKP